MSTGAVWRSCEAAATRRGRCELRAGRSELRLGSRRNLPAGPLPASVEDSSSPRAELYTGIGVDSTFLSAWSIIDGCTLQTRFLRIFGTTTTRHMITRLSSLYSQCGKGQMRAWLHITSQLTARTGVVYFASHRTILYAPSTASYIRFVLRARTHSTDSLRPSSPCRVSVHSGTCSVRRSVVGAHAHAHALHPCTVCPRACRDKGSRVLGSWACKCTRLKSRRLRSRTRNGRVHASAGLRGHQLRLFESCGCLKRPLAPTTLPHCHGTALQKEAAYRDDRTSNHAPQRRHMAALPFCNGSSAIPLTSHDVLNQTHRFRGSYV